MNLTRIATVAAGECERQHVGIDRLAMLLNGYEYAIAQSGFFMVPVLGDIAMIAGKVEPNNGGVFRSAPVTFANGGSATHHTRIYVALGRLVDALNEDNVLDKFGGDRENLAREFVRSFLSIHPYSDGNGRTAWVLYNWIAGTLDDPAPLPEFDWAGI